MDSVEELESSSGGLLKSEASEINARTNTNSIDEAYLFSSTDDLGKWTSFLPWNASVLTNLKQCPVSGESIVMICDGLAISSGNENFPIIRFKFGKTIYHLSMAATSATAKSCKEKSFDKSWIRSLFGKASTPIPPNATNNTATSQVLAQDRIAEALDLVSLKILHKGRLVFDAQSTISEEQRISISRTLLAISDQDWNNGNRKKPTLVVMGTRRNHRLKEPCGESVPNPSPFQILKQSIFLPFHLVYWPCKMSWYFVLSFLEPFLPPRWMISGSSDSESRPHED